MVERLIICPTVIDIRLGAIVSFPVCGSSNRTNDILRRQPIFTPHDFDPIIHSFDLTLHPLGRGVVVARTLGVHLHSFRHIRRSTILDYYRIAFARHGPCPHQVRFFVRHVCNRISNYRVSVGQSVASALQLSPRADCCLSFATSCVGSFLFSTRTSRSRSPILKFEFLSCRDGTVIVYIVHFILFRLPVVAFPCRKPRMVGLASRFFRGRA